jgi:hypothetical protein
MISVCRLRKTNNRVARAPQIRACATLRQGRTANRSQAADAVTTVLLLCLPHSRCTQSTRHLWSCRSSQNEFTRIPQGHDQRTPMKPQMRVRRPPNGITRNPSDGHPPTVLSVTHVEHVQQAGCGGLSICVTSREEQEGIDTAIVIVIVITSLDTLDRICTLMYVIQSLPLHLWEAQKVARSFSHSYGSFE